MSIANLVPFKPGAQHPRWSGGVTVCSTGYVRRTSGKYRHKYEHTAITLENLETAEVKPPIDLIGMINSKQVELHHFDGDREHNCRTNIQILQTCIHRAIELSKQTNLGVNNPCFPWQKKKVKK